MPLSSGISDYSRRLTILNPALGDSGFYECEAVLRSSSVPAVAEGAYLSVLGEFLPWAARATRAMSWGGGLSPPRDGKGLPGLGEGDPGATATRLGAFPPQSPRSSSRSRRGTSRPRWRRWWPSRAKPKVRSVVPPPSLSQPRARRGPIRDAAPALAGVPPPDMAWYKDASLLRPEQLPRFQLLADGSLQISGLLPDDTGMFQCFARNAAGEVQTTTYLAVTSRCQPLLVPWSLGCPARALGGVGPPPLGSMGTPSKQGLTSPLPVQALGRASWVAAHLFAPQASPPTSPGAPRTAR